LGKGTVIDSSHFIYFANWGINLKFKLIPGDPSTTLWNLISDASRRGGQRGVEIRALISTQLTSDYRSQFSAATLSLFTLFSSIPNGSFILDNNFLRYGSHHQKILIVKGEQGLIGFCGGVDFVSNRLHGPPAGSMGSGSGSGSSSGSGILGPQHDVHCRIEGPAAWDLLKIFIQRWDDHPNKPSKSSLLGKGEPLPGVKGPVYVQIGRTFGNRKRWRGIERKKREEISKLKDENDRRPSGAAAIQALPERIQKPEGDSSDQCRKEEGAPGGGGNTHEVTTISNAQEQQHDNQENDRSKSPA
jgi:phosphatidylserine/phosphatidylglycerophosphate/cardiolipin synthase-like enzyme